MESGFHSPDCKTDVLDPYTEPALSTMRGVYGTEGGELGFDGGMGELERPRPNLFCFGLAPIARRIMLFIVLTVLALTLTA